jgi:surface protein
MATITAEAKLYNGWRLLCVDKNITANLSSSFSIGNRNRPCGSESLDIEVSPNVKICRIRKTAAGLEAISGVNLVDTRLLTFGGGNRAGVLNPAQPWTATASLSCKFPTYVRFDLEALGVPEGTNIILQMEEGFVIEGDYSGTERKPLSKVSNLLSFRTPKKFAAYPVAVSSVSLPNPFLFRTFVINVDSLFNPNFQVIATKNFGIDLFVNSQILSAITYSNALFTADLIFRVDNGFTNWNPETGGLINTRLRYFDSSLNLQTQTNIDVQRLRLLDDDFTITTQVSADIERFISDVNVGNISSQVTMTTDVQVTRNLSMTLQAQASTSTTPTVNIGMIENLQSQFSLIGDGTIAMVFEVTGDTLQLPILYGSVNCSIDWGDGTSTVVTSTNGASITHTYQSPYGSGITKTIKISGYIQHFGFAATANVPDWGQNSSTANGLFWAYDNVSRIISFGDLGTETYVAAFTNMRRATSIPTRLPSTITDISGMFWHTIADDQFQNINNVSGWDVSNVTKMERTFLRNRQNQSGGFNPDIGGWDVSNVTNMTGIFVFADNGFNPDLSGWCVSYFASDPGISNLDFSTWPLARRPVWGTCP